MDMTNANGPSGNMVLDDIRSSSPTPGGSGALPASNSVSDTSVHHTTADCDLKSRS